MYSFTGLSREILKQLVAEEKRLNGYKYWCHPDFEHKDLGTLRGEGVEAPDRRET
jgi:hypothetical protein